MVFAQQTGQPALEKFDRLRRERNRSELDMTRPVSVRLDDEALRALGRLEATGMSRSEAIRKALVVAASRLENMNALASELAALEANEDDRLEMLAVAELMESLRASG